jgi:hypothetical protein
LKKGGNGMPINPDVICYQIQLSEVLDKEHYIQLLEEFQDGEEIIAFDLHSDSTSVFGFMKKEIDEDERIHQGVRDLIKEIIDDVEKENPDGIYEYEGYRVVILYTP